MRGIGVEDVSVVNAFDLEGIENTIRRCVESEQPSVIISRGDCPTLTRTSGVPLQVDPEKCNSCYACLRVGCPAITVLEDKAFIEASQCVGAGCSICAQVCPQEAIAELAE